MNKFTIAAVGAVLLAGATPGYAATNCNDSFKNFFEMLQANGNVKLKMSGDELAEAARKGVRAYDGCKSGDTFTPHGVWDAIEAEKMAKAK